MHFNEMLMTLRQIGISAVIAVFGAAAVVLGRKQFLVASLIILFGLGLLVGTWWLDHQYYYKMLLASVAQGETIDRELFNKDGREGLTTTISNKLQKEEASNALHIFYGIPVCLGVLFLLSIAGYMGCSYFCNRQKSA